MHAAVVQLSESSPTAVPASGSSSLSHYKTQLSERRMSERARAPSSVLKPRPPSSVALLVRVPCRLCSAVRRF